MTETPEYARWTGSRWEHPTCGWDATRAGWYYTTTQDWVRLDDALHSTLAASAAVRKDERERLAEAWDEGAAAPNLIQDPANSRFMIPPPNPYRSPSLAAPEGTGEKP